MTKAHIFLYSNPSRATRRPLNWAGFGWLVRDIIASEAASAVEYSLAQVEREFFDKNDLSY